MIHSIPFTARGLTLGSLSSENWDRNQEIPLIDTRLTNLAASLLLLVLLSACQSSGKIGPEAVAGQTPSGTVEMKQAPVAYIGGAGRGSGTLYDKDKAYPPDVAGLGVGGIGALTLDVT